MIKIKYLIVNSSRMSIVMSLVQINQRLMLDVDEQIVRERVANHERKVQQIIQIE